MGGRHRVFKPGEWYCADCDDSHVGSCPCCIRPDQPEPGYLRAFWAVFERVTRKSTGSSDIA